MGTTTEAAFDSAIERLDKLRHEFIQREREHEEDGAQYALYKLSDWTYLIEQLEKVIPEIRSEIEGAFLLGQEHPEL